MGTPVGIDLGTTNSAIARVDEYGRPVIIVNARGESITPSVICFKDGRPIVGREAKELQAAGAPQVAAFFKREMGDENFVFFANDKDHSAVDLSAMVLDRLKRDAEDVLGERLRDAVITVPAYFRNHQREATIEAGRRVGFDVLQVINEPTAAAIAYGLKPSGNEQVLLVYDLGGGTFDVTVLRLGKGEIRVLTSDGDSRLGGKDWDDRIIEFLATRFQEEFGADPFEDSESLADLLTRAEEAKKAISTTTSTRLSLFHAGNTGRYLLDRPTFERITHDLMERTMSLTHKALKDCAITPRDVDGVLLVGGSTRMPMVHDFVSRAFGRPPMPGINVDEAVALGAAVVAAEHVAARDHKQSAPVLALRGKTKTVDVTNHSLGMIALNELRTSYVNSLVLPKNATIPCSQLRPYQHRTRRSGSNHLEIFMTQGESELPGEVTFLGMYTLQEIPHTSTGVSVIDISYDYDSSGTVKVTGRVRGSSQPLRMTVEKLPADVPARFLRPPEQPPEPQHVTAYLAFDLSGSMSGQPLEEARRAARGFLEHSDLSHCSIGIIAFADTVKVALDACQNARRIEQAIAALSIGETGFGNGTDPFEDARARLKKVKGPRFIITLADGVWSGQEEAIRQAKICHSDGIDIIAVGFGSADRTFLRQIASSDDASFFTSLGGLTETFSSIAQVLTETAGESPKSEAGRKSFLSLLRR